MNPVLFNDFMAWPPASPIWTLSYTHFSPTAVYSPYSVYSALCKQNPHSFIRSHRFLDDLLLCPLFGLWPFACYLPWFQCPGDPNISHHQSLCAYHPLCQDFSSRQSHGLFFLTCNYLHIYSYVFSINFFR